MCIYGRELPYMRIYGRKKCAFTENKNAHLWKLSSVYVHFAFRICAFTEAKMRIYGMTFGTMTYGTMTCGTMTSGTMTFETMTSGTMTCGTMTSGTMTYGTMTYGTMTSGTMT
jgi:hypothetical protein